MIIPCGHRLIVKPFKQEDVDDTLAAAKKLGIEIINNNKKREDQSIDKGIVVSIGPDCWPNSNAPWCSVGDTVYFAKFSPKFVEDKDGISYGILNDEDICAVIKEA
jgi:co-chaperonin GroES (HSP10)